LNKNILLFLSFLCFHSLKAQSWISDSIQVDYNVRSIYIDPLSNKYLVSEEMQIQKYKPDGTFWNRYENNRLGSIGWVDVSNPFMVLVFYPQYQSLVILDNNMSESGRLNFSSIGFGNVRTAAISDDNNIWILDEGNRKLTKIKTSGEIVVDGIPYFGFDIDGSKPIHLLQKSNFVYISQAGKKVQVFDIFGKWVKSIDLEGLTFVIYIDKSIFYKDDNKIVEYPIDNLNIEPLKTLPLSGMRSITYDVIRQRFYGLDPDNKIYYYKL